MTNRWRGSSAIKKSAILAGAVILALAGCRESVPSGTDSPAAALLEETARRVRVAADPNGKADPGDTAASRRQAAAESEGPVDFAALRRVNPDTVAWLAVPGTDINYPVVQAGDNEKYLDINFEGVPDAAGAVWLDCESSPDLRGFHSIFYGHHMKNGTMFAQLARFREEDFFASHREIVLYLPQGELRLKTVAAVLADAGGDKRQTEFDSREQLRGYADEMTKSCPFRELPDREFESLYSFVTCSYEFEDARTILYAVEEPTLPD